MDTARFGWWVEILRKGLTGDSPVSVCRLSELCKQHEGDGNDPAAAAQTRVESATCSPLPGDVAVEKSDTKIRQYDIGYTYSGDRGDVLGISIQRLAALHLEFECLGSSVGQWTRLSARRLYIHTAHYGNNRVLYRNDLHGSGERHTSLCRIAILCE